MHYGNHSNTGSRFVRRKTAPGVKGGKVQRKNRRDDEPAIYSGSLTIRTEVPRWPNLHVLREEDIRKFIGILPDWEELSRGLEEIVLADRDEVEVDGWYSSGTVAICAWAGPIGKGVRMIFHVLCGASGRAEGRCRIPAACPAGAV